jgi:hypothetical protein
LFWVTGLDLFHDAAGNSIRIYKTIILPVVLYGCETWSLTLREEPRLGVFENKVPRRIFGSWGDEVTGEWRKLHNEEFHDLYSSPSKIRTMKSRTRWAGHVARMGRRGMRIGCWGELWRELDNIRMDLVEVEWGDVDWIGLVWDRD